MAKDIDHTRNTSGPSNMLPTPVWRPCAISNLIDDFIKDGWIAPENKWLEIASLYKNTSRMDYRRLYSAYKQLEKIERIEFEKSWPSRWLDYLEGTEVQSCW